MACKIEVLRLYQGPQTLGIRLKKIDTAEEVPVIQPHFDVKTDFIHVYLAANAKASSRMHRSM